MKKLFTLLLALVLHTLINAATPNIISFSPTNGAVGTLVTITGTNLGSPTTFTIGGVSAIIVSNNGSQLVGMVMPGAFSGTVSLTTGGGATSSAGNFTVLPTNYPGEQQGSKLVGTGNTGAAQQGYSVSVSADGNTAIVGGYTDNNGYGAAWIYARSAGVWSQQGSKLVGTGGTSASSQGCSVSLSADGNTAIVGGDNDNNYQGAAWIFTRLAGIWSQQGSKLVGIGGTSEAQQGYSVSLSADGNTAIVGGVLDNAQQGAAWVYTRSAGVWSQQGNKLVGTGGTSVAKQGCSVSLSADGNTAIVGGYGDNISKGAAWIYTRSAGVWSQQGSKLISSGDTGAAAQGCSVSLSADGNTAIIGGYWSYNYQGAAWIFTRSAGVWSQQGSKLVGTGNTEMSRQGYSVSLSADGNSAIVGGYTYYGQQGATWVFNRTSSVWSQQGSKLIGTGGTSDAMQSFSVSLSADGNTAIVGGFNDDSQQGAAWVFKPLAAVASIQASSITFSSVQSTQMTINWTNGNGEKRAVFVKEGTGTISNPSDNTTYASSTDWNSKGTQLSTSGYYCVYNNNSNSVTLTGLNPGTQYTVQVFDYNGSAGSEMYYTLTATDNPKSQTTTWNWTGTTNTDWNTLSNWSPGSVPTASISVTILNVTNKPIINQNSDSPAVCNNLTIQSGATLTIASGKALTVSGTLTNNATGGIIIQSDGTNGTGSLIAGSVNGAGSALVQRYMTSNGWHMVSSPLKGQSIASVLTGNSNISTTSGTRGMMSYNPTSNVWNDHFTNTQSGNLGNGTGFGIHTDADGIVTFAGSLQAGTQSVTGLTAGMWNCVGNPYTSAIGINANGTNTDNFLNVNGANLDPSYGAIYVWEKTDAFNGSSGQYTIINSIPTPYNVQQGQGFFVKMKNAVTTLSFTPAMQYHNGSLAFKSLARPWPLINLIASSGDLKSSTLIAFNSAMTKGLDPTYDAGLLKGGSDLQVYTRLIEDNGIAFGIQTLPDNDFTNMTIPVGVDYTTGGEVVFSAASMNLPTDCKVVLEDKMNGSLIDLSKVDYHTILPANTHSTDRFLLHTAGGLEQSKGLSAYANRNIEIHLTGTVSKGSVAILYDINGKIVMAKNLVEGSLNVIPTPQLKTGLYVLSVNDNGKITGLKVMINE